MSANLSVEDLKLAKILYSRCLENELKPDKLQFTKFLYLIDYCHQVYRGSRVTSIEWIFFHYGPWSFSMPAVMDGVMAEFPFGWRDRTEEFEGRMPSFDPIGDRLGLTLEGIIIRIIKAFKDKDTNAVIEWCYKQTEPMLRASRGDRLDFSLVPCRGELPEFFPTAQTWEMPKIPAHILEKSASLRARIAANAAARERYLRFKRNLSSDTYAEGIQVMLENNTAIIPKMDGATVTWDKSVVDALREKDE